MIKLTRFLCILLISGLIAGTAGQAAPQPTSSRLNLPEFSLASVDADTVGLLTDTVFGVWSADTVFVADTIQVPQGYTLTIESGVHVIFLGNYQFKVYGLLQAIGTESDSIIFTAATTAGWGGLRFYSANVNSRLDYCHFEKGRAHGSYAEYGCGGAIFMYGGIQSITHCSFVDNTADKDGGAVYLWGGTPEFAYNLFTKNRASAATPSDTAHGHAMFMGNCQGIMLNHVTISGNGPINSGFSLYVENGDRMAMKNSILWEDTSKFDFDFDAIEYSLLKGYLRSALEMMGTGNMSDDGYLPAASYVISPHFVDSTAGNLRVKNYSKTIDAAKPGPPFANEPMPNGGRANMGAYGNSGQATVTVPRLSFRKDRLETVTFRKKAHPDSTATSIECGLQRINTPDLMPDSILIYNIGRTDMRIGQDSLTLHNIDTLFTNNYNLLKDTVYNAIVIPSYDSVWVAVEFHPVQIAHAYDSLTILSTDTSFHIIIQIHGTGVNPVITMLPDSVQFGLVSYGSLDSTTIGIRNDGHNQGNIQSDLVLAFGAIGSSAPSFNFFLMDTSKASNPYWIDAVIPVGVTKYFRLYFQPFGPLSYSAYLVANSNAGKDSIFCSGAGSSAIAHYDIDTLQYGVVTLGQTKMDTIHIWNTGGLPLTLTGSRFILPGSATTDTTNNFSIASLPITIGPGDTITFPIFFHPTSVGPRASRLKIGTSIPSTGDDSLSVRLFGTGTSVANYQIDTLDGMVFTKAAQPYYVVGDAYVSPGQTLTIEDSVQVKFEGNFKITIEGTLIANGLPGKPISFTTISSDSVWKGLRFKQGSSGSVLRYCEFFRGADTSEGTGGVVSIESASPLFEFCQFYNNGTYHINQANNDTITFGTGGAVAILGNSAAKFKHCQFYNNRSKDGGALYAGWLSHPLLDSCQIHHNKAVKGGGLHLAGTYGVVNYCEIHDNIADSTGGGVYFTSGSTTEMKYNRIHTNRAKYGAGVAIVYYTQPYIHDELIYNNTATTGGRGAGLFIQDGCTPIIQKTLIADNLGAPLGRAVYTQSSTARINSCTFVGQPQNTTGWLFTAAIGDGAMITNSILGSSTWADINYLAVSAVSSPIEITYSDVQDTSQNPSVKFPGPGNHNENPMFVGSGTSPDTVYALQTVPPSPALQWSETNGPIGFTGTPPLSDWNLLLTMQQNPVNPSILNFVLSSKRDLLAPPYLRLEQDLPGDTLGYITIDSTFMDRLDGDIYIQPFMVQNANILCRMTVDLTNRFLMDTLLQQTFIASNLTGTFSTMSLGDVILMGRSISGSGIWAMMPELYIYADSMLLDSQLKGIGSPYKVLTSSPQLADGRLEFVLNQNLLGGREARKCAIAQWNEDSWQILSSTLSSDLSTIWADLYEGGSYRVVWGEGLNTAVLPSQLELAQNFPNPFNPETIIRFSLPQAGQVKLTIFDVLGRQVVTLMDSQLNAGVHQVVWSGMNTGNQPVSSGVYFYRLQMGGKQVSKKMILLR